MPAVQRRKWREFKGNNNGYPSIIHKAFTLMNEYKLLEVDTKKMKQPKKCKLRTST